MINGEEGEKIDGRTWRDCRSGQELVKEAGKLQIILEGLRQVLLN